MVSGDKNDANIITTAYCGQKHNLTANFSFPTTGRNGPPYMIVVELIRILNTLKAAKSRQRGTKTKLVNMY